ncbi:hypothetical protein MMC25_004515 [Agyrium rufum]|nr:hypothetical protein [Agyrium rufum]
MSSVSQQRQPSKPSKQPPSSFMAVQRITSPRDYYESRPTTGSQSPLKSSAAPPNPNERPRSPDGKRKHSTAHGRASSTGGGVSDGIGNLNRWSQSTVSSKSSSVIPNKRSSFARRLSGSFGSFGAFGAPQSPPTNKSVISKSRTSEERIRKAPSRAPGSSQGPNRPPISSSRSNTRVSIAGPSSMSVAEYNLSPGLSEPYTPSTTGGEQSDYFANTRNERSPKRRETTNGGSPAPERASRAREQNGSGTHLSNLRNLGSPEASTSGVRAPSNRSDRDRERRPRTTTKHSRSRDASEKGSGGGTEAGSSTSSLQSPQDPNRRRRAPSQKAMLSRALQKANHAVQLDNAQNFEGAMDAYGDACDLLTQVMLRSSGDDDRKKLEAIRNTYKNRIDELQTNEIPSLKIDTKALPDRPMSLDSRSPDPFSPITDEDSPIVETATVSRLGEPPRPLTRSFQPTLTRDQLPPRRASLMPTMTNMTTMPFSFGGEDDLMTPSMTPQLTPEITPIINQEQNSYFVPASHSVQASLERNTAPSSGLAPPASQDSMMPPPLSPRRPLSPAPAADKPIAASKPKTLPKSAPSESVPTNQTNHSHQDTVESTSWLDTIDESDASSGLSMHSRTSSTGLRRKHIKKQSNDSQTDFDAALDAAVEAAYDDGLEPIDEVENRLDETDDYDITPRGNTLSDVRKNIEAAKQRVREAAEEAERAFAKNQVSRERQAALASRGRSNSVDPDYAEDEAEEEERILEEMTRDYIMDEIEYHVQSKSALPRQSDVSGSVGRSLGNTAASSTNTTDKAPLSTVAEPLMSSKQPALSLPLSLPPARPPPKGGLPPPPLAPPPVMALPPPPKSALPLPPTTALLPPPTTALPPPPPIAIPRKSSPQPLPTRTPSIAERPNIRERRLSSQRVRHLTIDTDAALPPGMVAPRTQPPSLLPPVMSTPRVVEPPKSALPLRESQQFLPNLAFKPTFPSNSGAREREEAGLATLTPAIAVTPKSDSANLEPLVSPLTPASNRSRFFSDTTSSFVLNESPPRVQSRELNVLTDPRKNASSTSLKNIKSAVLLPPTPSDEAHDIGTPVTRVLSQISTQSGRTFGATNTLAPTVTSTSGSTIVLPEINITVQPSIPGGVNFTTTRITTRGVQYYDPFSHTVGASSTEHPPPVPSQTKRLRTSQQASIVPAPLEPCPDSFLLRPFWLLRTIYQTISHPRGGYLTTRLFVPRDIWLVKNVKIKCVEEKIAQCDLLSAALQKLARVDTLDADAVLVEMQELEGKLDAVQAIWNKKLGADVGPNAVASGALWKGTSPIATAGEGTNGAYATSSGGDGKTNSGNGGSGTAGGDANGVLGNRSSNTSSGKSYLPSWRRMRNKNTNGQGLPPLTTVTSNSGSTHSGGGSGSAGGFGSSGGRDGGGGGSGGGGGNRLENFTIRSLPMTASATVKEATRGAAKRDASKVVGVGQHAGYMVSLARLCDAAQVLDQIARQVEDPGLKHSSQTHVGLELSARHAAEFFGFYVCRFVLVDLEMMINKFIKRGTEWANS